MLNKKGIKMELRTIAELFLVVIVLFATLVIFAKLYSLFVVGKVDAGTLNNFNRLAGPDGIVEQVLADNNDSLKVESSLMIASNYVVVGFNSKCTSYEKDVGCPISMCESGDSTYNIPKPKNCRSDSACLCLFEEDAAGDDFQNENNKPLECYSYKGNLKFYSDVASEGFVRGSEDADLVIYGSCGLGHVDFGIRNIFVNKDAKGDVVELGIFAH